MPKLTVRDLRRKKPITIEHFVPADEEQASDLASAAKRLSLAEFGGDEKQVEEARAALKAAQDAVRKSGVVVVLTSVGRVRFQEIIDENPPAKSAVDAAKAAGEPVPSWNPDTFFPALLAATADSDLTAEQWVSEVFESKAWNENEVQELREKALLANQATRVGELGN